MDRLTLKLNTGGNPCASTRTYDKLFNKPRINGVELMGEITLGDLHIASADTEAGWEENSAYIPGRGEVCAYTDTARIKIGDGETPISELPYVNAEYNTLRDDGDGLYVSSIVGNDVAAEDTEYDHIDFYNGTETVTHTLKDALARQLISDLGDEMPKNVRDGAGRFSIEEGCLAKNGVFEPVSATGMYSHAEGEGTSAEALASHAEGSGTRAVISYAHAEGVNTEATQQSAHAEGSATHANGVSAHAEGNNTTATGQAAHAEGYKTETYGNYSHAEGEGTIAKGVASHVGGRYNIVDSFDNWDEWVPGTTYVVGAKVRHGTGAVNGYICMQNNADSTWDSMKWDSAVQYNYAEIIGNGSYDFGTQVTTRSNARTLDWEGNEELAGSLTIGGELTLRKGNADEYTLTAQRLAVIPHNIKDGTGECSIVEGFIEDPYSQSANVASGNYSHAEGFATIASGNAAHAEGERTTASGRYSHAEGGRARAIGDFSHAEGYSTKATHKAQHVFGRFNAPDPSVNQQNDFGKYVEIVGNGALTGVLSNARTLDWDGNEALAGGLTLGLGSADEIELTAVKLRTLETNVSNMMNTVGNIPLNMRDGTGAGSVVLATDVPSRASGDYAVAESSGNASGRSSHAEGNGTLAQGNYSHAEGYNGTATGEAAHSEGFSAIANGAHSHAEGHGTIASGEDQHVGGRWNVDDTTSAEIIGNGAPNSRKNARKLDWSGNEYLAGGLTLGMGTTDEVTISALQLKQLLALIN